MADEKLAAQVGNRSREDLRTLAQNRLRSLQSKFKDCPLPMVSGMHHGEQTKYIRYDVSSLKSPLELIHVTDMQFGHVLCNEQKVIEYRDWILSSPNRYMLWGGDCIDAGTKISVGSPWEQKMEPQGQIYAFCEVWATARHRILGYVGGNHERRGIQTFGDLGSLIAYLLEIPYSAGRQFLDFNFGRKDSFRVDLWHGTGSARTAGAKMQMLSRFMSSGDAQIYLVGHLHDAMVKIDSRIKRDPSSNRVYLEKIAGAMSSSFLEYFGSYAEVMGLPPSSLHMARIIVEPNNKWELTIK